MPRRKRISIATYARLEYGQVVRVRGTCWYVWDKTLYAGKTIAELSPAREQDATTVEECDVPCGLR